MTDSHFGLKIPRYVSKDTTNKFDGFPDLLMMRRRLLLIVANDEWAAGDHCEAKADVGAAKPSHTLPAYQNLAAAIISHQSWSSLAIYHILPCLIRLHCSVHRHSSCLVYELSPKLSYSSDFVVTPWISNRDAVGSKKSWQGLLSLPWETRSHIRQFQYSPGSTLYAGHSNPYNSSNMHPTMVQPILLASTNIQPVQAIRSVLSRCLHPRLQNCPLLRCGLGTEWLPTTRIPQTACIVYRN